MALRKITFSEVVIRDLWIVFNVSFVMYIDSLTWEFVDQGTLESNENCDTTKIEDSHSVQFKRL